MVSAHAGGRKVDSAERKYKPAEPHTGNLQDIFPAMSTKICFIWSHRAMKRNGEADDLSKSCFTLYFHKKLEKKAVRLFRAVVHELLFRVKNTFPQAGRVRNFFQFSKYFHQSRDFQVKRAIRVRLIALYILTPFARKKTVSRRQPFLKKR